jgi:hypothetical protein
MLTDFRRGHYQAQSQFCRATRMPYLIGFLTSVVAPPPTARDPFAPISNFQSKAMPTGHRWTAR